jgi:hypothetical protein
VHTRSLACLAFLIAKNSIQIPQVGVFFVKSDLMVRGKKELNDLIDSSLPKLYVARALLLIITKLI